MKKMIFICAASSVAIITGVASLAGAENLRTVANHAIMVAHDYVVPDFLQRKWDVAGLERVKSYIINTYPGVPAARGRDLVLMLRNIAYTRVKVGSDGGNLNDPWESFSEAVVNQTSSHSCQGINIVYRIMLTAFGFETREVDFFGDDEIDSGETLYSHATTDVLIDGKWEATDATFNVSLRDAEGNRISWSRAFDLTNTGGQFSYATDGNDTLKGRGKSAASSSIGPAMKYASIIGKESVSKPKGWDGELNFIGHIRLDTQNDASQIYFRLPDLASR